MDFVENQDLRAQYNTNNFNAKRMSDTSTGFVATLAAMSFWNWLLIIIAVLIVVGLICLVWRHHARKRRCRGKKGDDEDDAE